MYATWIGSVIKPSALIICNYCSLFILHVSICLCHDHITVFASWHINSSITVTDSSRMGESVLPVDMWKHRVYDMCNSIEKATIVSRDFASQCQGQACELKHGTEGTCPVEFHRRSWEHNPKKKNHTQTNREYRCIIVCKTKEYIGGEKNLLRKPSIILKFERTL